MYFIEKPTQYCTNYHRDIKQVQILVSFLLIFCCQYTTISKILIVEPPQILPIKLFIIAVFDLSLHKYSKISYYQMSSKSPQAIRHFIPLDFSKQVLDYKNTPTRSYVKVDQNPLQNMKLRFNEHQNNPNFTLVYKNKSNKQFMSKFKIKTTRLLKQMQTQSKKCSIIKRQIINQERKMQINSKPLSRQRPTSISCSKAQTSQVEFKRHQNRLIRQNQKEVIPRKIFSCKSFRKFTTVSTAKPRRNIQRHDDLVSYFQPLECNLKVEGRKNHIDFF